MKKLTLVLALLVACGLVGAVAQADATLTGEATATIGFDLDTQSFGMTNEMDAQIVLELVPESTVESEATDGWYGWIELADFAIKIDSDGKGVVTDADGDDETLVVTATAPSITAKITNGMIYVTIYALDGFATSLIDAIEGDEDDDYEVEDDETAVDVAADLDDSTAGGVTIGYDAGLFNVALNAATFTGFSDEDPADNGFFLIGVDAGVMVGPAEITAELVRGIGVEENLGFGVKADVAIDPVDVYVGFDGLMPDVGDLAWEIGAGASGTFGPATVAADFIYGDATDMDLETSVDLDFAPLTVGIFADLYDSFTEYHIGGTVGYDVNENVSVSAEGAYDLDEGVTTLIPINLTVTMDLIPNTTFTLAYDTPDVANDLGEISFATKVAY